MMVPLYDALTNALSYVCCDLVFFCPRVGYALDILCTCMCLWFGIVVLLSSYYMSLCVLDFYYMHDSGCQNLWLKRGSSWYSDVVPHAGTCVLDI